ncbi:hypothetical protein T484DRAFT_1857931 [Baffinella frigidus]|nr:hypothetical protein T484DRAFT_1857931 [Cryptophyta sp. CCMP2293]
MKECQGNVARIASTVFLVRVKEYQVNVARIASTVFTTLFITAGLVYAQESPTNPAFNNYFQALYSTQFIELIIRITCLTVYAQESPTNPSFNNYFQALYFATTTLTTVGFP